MATQTRGPEIAEPEQDNAQSPPKPAPKARKSKVIRFLLFGIILIGAAYFGIKWWNHLQTYEETDDSYVTGHSHPLSFRVSGTVSEVLVDDNQSVKAGQPIGKLDPRDFEVQLKQAQADLERAKGQLIQSDAQIAQAEAQLTQAEAQSAAVKAKTDDSKRIFDRNSQLFFQGHGVVSKQDLDNAQFSHEGDAASYNAALASVKVSHANVETAKAQRAASVAQVDAAQAAVENANLQLSYTTLFSPTDGRIAKKTLEVGQRVQPAQQVMAVVEPNIWIVANYKETQLGRIRPGQPVEIRIDAISKKQFEGVVDSFQPGTGAVFALLPSDNATGNFTKIVQRVPVKIVFRPESIKGYEDRVVPGLSTVPSIRVK
jgi:membrane fusion protein, multidrug efflux system